MESQDATSTPAQVAARVKRRMRFILGGAASLIVLAAVAWLTGFGSYIYQRAAYTPTRPTFAGNSDRLQQTVIVPTLDSPSPPGKNVIWCSSFQLAWNEVRDKVIGAPLQVIGAEEVAARLNAAMHSSSDLDPKSFYVAGGWTKDGVIDKIEKDMAAKFPSHVVPDLHPLAGGILAYSFLTANVPFRYPFRQVDSGLIFRDSRGARTAVEAFGLSETDESSYLKIREQVAVLYCRRSDKPNRWEFSEYVLDLCRHSRPYEVVVAVVESKGSLAQTLEYVRSQMHEFKSRGHSDGTQALGRNDIVKVPEMIWRIDHRFSDLIGKTVANVNMPIVEARQTTVFRLDRRGAVLKSEARLAVKSAPEEFVFDRPFLVYMQKRGAAQPFFVMWVDNAELLTRR
jgi:hypothetical protein